MACRLGPYGSKNPLFRQATFPVTARKAEITKDTSALKPLEIKMPNSKSVKLGLDNDWWELPAMIAGALLLLGGAAFLVIKRRKKLEGSEE